MGAKNCQKRKDSWRADGGFKVEKFTPAIAVRLSLKAAPSRLSLGSFHRFDDFLGFDTDAGDAQEKVDHVLLVIGEAVGVEFFANGGVFGGFFFVLVKNPFQGRAVAELVIPGGLGNAG